MTKNLNAKLFSNELFDDWVTREELIPAEEWLLSKYLTDKSKNVLEAGTGGGRIAFQIERMGFNNITAFDFVSSMIEFASSKAQKLGSSIIFKTLDASNLSVLEDNSFDYLVYLQQVLCFIDKENLFENSLKEAYRISKKGEITIFSFLNFPSRKINYLLSPLLGFLRSLRNEKIAGQYLPWLKFNNRINWKLFNRNQPLTYWVKKEQIVSLLESTGFSILEVGTESELKKSKDPDNGMLYVVCRSSKN
jgi:ubiquinone/menaquinone biosynthesis C-methylase UbiE